MLYRNRSLRIFVTLACLCATRPAWGSSILPISAEQLTQQADVICRGTVLEVTAVRHEADQRIYTIARLRVDEALKGKPEAVIELVHPGGTLDDESDENGFAPQLRAGEQWRFYLTQRDDGTYYSMHGVASAWREGFQMFAVTPSGLLTDANGVPGRFVLPDRGEPIPYVIDNQALPSGISLTQATNAVRQALNAWAAVTSITFEFDGFQIFGQGADTVTNRDHRLYLQLHDLYGRVPPGNVLGIGGRSTSSQVSLFPTGGLGGRVGATEFNWVRSGFVVLNHTNAYLQVPANLAEVLCHEIGHAIGLAHSSETDPEPSTLLREAIMYYRAHGDGRGASLGAYDPPIIAKAHPTTYTPPYGYDRVIYCVTASSPLTAHPEVRQVLLKGYDLQSSALSVVLTNATTTNGVFSALGNVLTYTPSGSYSDTSVLDPAGTGFRDRVYARYDDGTNASPYVLTRVIQYLRDTQPAGAPDSLPDSWMTTYFGSATPVAGVSGANDDADGDGLTNIREFQAGTNPVRGDSTFRVAQLDGAQLAWTGRPYELYEIESSTNLVSFQRLGNPVLLTTNTVTTAIAPGPPQFLRIYKVP